MLEREELLAAILIIIGVLVLAIGLQVQWWKLTIVDYIPEGIIMGIFTLGAWGFRRRIFKIVGENQYTYIPTPPPVTLSNTKPTELLPGKRFNGFVTISNPLGNSIVLVGGFAGEDDEPYFLPDRVCIAGNGIKVMPGQSTKFKVNENSRLSAIAQKNGDIIEIQSILSD
jgi:hypothetical protein